ncbi:MAG: hypothetical protein J1F18_09495 [Lachnospiraceae bacterium]|nr:hypothetical protein [Lachnospiraceae bacterium]
MKKRQICIGLVSLAMVSLSACDDAKTAETTESQASEAEILEAGESQASESEELDEADVPTSESETYGIKKTPMEGSTDSEYEISDMLPRPSDDTFIMTVEEAEAFMNKNANKGTDAEAEEPDEPEE